MKTVDRHGVQHKIKQIVAFDSNIDIVHVQPYSECYAKHPRLFMLTGPITNKPSEHMMDISHDHNAYTGLHAREQHRVPGFLLQDAHRRREELLRRILQGGPAWEKDSGVLLDEFCAAVRKQKAKRLLHYRQF